MKMSGFDGEDVSKLWRRRRCESNALGIGREECA